MGAAGTDCGVAEVKLSSPPGPPYTDLDGCVCEFGREREEGKRRLKNVQWL